MTRIQSRLTTSHSTTLIQTTTVSPLNDCSSLLRASSISTFSPPFLNTAAKVIFSNATQIRSLSDIKTLQQLLILFNIKPKSSQWHEALPEELIPSTPTITSLTSYSSNPHLLCFSLTEFLDSSIGQSPQGLHTGCNLCLEHSSSDNHRLTPSPSSNFCSNTTFSIRSTLLILCKIAKRHPLALLIPLSSLFFLFSP